MNGKNSSMAAKPLDMSSENADMETAINAVKRPIFQKNITIRTNVCGPMLKRTLHLLSPNGST